MTRRASNPEDLLAERLVRLLELLWPTLRDVAAFAVGVWILLFKEHASTTLQVIGFACLGITTSGIGSRIVEKLASPPKDPDTPTKRPPTKRRVRP